jgi:hypothetical protein
MDISGQRLEGMHYGLGLAATGRNGGKTVGIAFMQSCAKYVPLYGDCGYLKARVICMLV